MARQEPDDARPRRMRTVVETNVYRRHPGDQRDAAAAAPLGRAAHRQRLQQRRLADLAGRPGRSTSARQAAYAPSKSFLNAVTVQYATAVRRHEHPHQRRLPGPGRDRLHRLPRTARPQQGAAIAIRLATLPDDGPTGASSTTTAPSPGERYQTLARQLQRSSRRPSRSSTARAVHKPRSAPTAGRSIARRAAPSARSRRSSSCCSLRPGRSRPTRERARRRSGSRS